MDTVINRIQVPPGDLAVFGESVASVGYGDGEPA